jgi:hypothetical protein
MTCKCEQDFIIKLAGPEMYFCPIDSYILKPLTTMLYCASCTTIFDKGCIHSENNYRVQSYCAKIITSYKFIGVNRKFQGMPKFKQVVNFEKLTDIVWECTCNFRDRCKLDKKGWIANCRNSPIKCFDYISSTARSLQIFTNGECYLYLLCEFFDSLNSYQVLNIIEQFFPKKILQVDTKPFKKMTRKDFYSGLSKMKI